MWHLSTSEWKNAMVSNCNYWNSRCPRTVKGRLNCALSTKPGFVLHASRKLVTRNFGGYRAGIKYLSPFVYTDIYTASENLTQLKANKLICSVINKLVTVSNCNVKMMDATAHELLVTSLSLERVFNPREVMKKSKPKNNTNDLYTIEALYVSINVCMNNIYNILCLNSSLRRAVWSALSCSTSASWPRSASDTSTVSTHPRSSSTSFLVSAPAFVNTA